MDGYKQKMIVTMAIHLVIFYSFQDVHGVRQKRELIFLSGRRSHWNDHVLYCNSAHSGRLLTVENATVTFVLQKYFNLHWNNWVSSVWNGLYMSDFTNGDFFYRWQGTCQEAEYFNWKKYYPIIEEKCTKIDLQSFQWKATKCDNAAYSICEKYIGSCTFEKDPEEKSCSVDSSTVSQNNITSVSACLSLCSVQDDCWAVHYDEKTTKCWLSSSSDPFRFDSGGSTYSSPCSDDDMQNVAIYWKRCFAHGEDTTPIPTYSHSPPTEPKPLCELIVEATTHHPDVVTTTKETATTTTAIHTQPYPRGQIVTTEETVTVTPEIVTSRVISYLQPNRRRTTDKSATQYSTTTSMSPTENGITTTEIFTKSTKLLEPSNNKSTNTEITESAGNKYDICHCRCHEAIDLDAYIEAVLISLKRNRKEMSKYKRKLISVEDNRFSSKTIGLSLGLGVIVSVVLAIVLSDVCRLIKRLHKEKHSPKRNLRIKELN